MKSKLRAYTALVLGIAGLLLVAPAPPGSSAAPPTASLSISHDVYVGGQNVRFTGNIGARGVRVVKIQIQMSGDSWTDLPSSRARTKPNGSFNFRHPAPSMFNMGVRVASGRFATPHVIFHAKSQDVVLDIQPNDPGLASGEVLAGRSFSILVDTTPTTLRGRNDLPPPAFPGRVLTLQERVKPHRWQTLDRTVTDAEGEGRFEVTEGNTRWVVYRVRQENWTEGGSRIGWFPSFPTYVHVVDAPSALGPSAPSGAPEATGPAPSGPPPGQSDGPGPPQASGPPLTAAEAYGWRPAMWDFAWEFGESLTSGPYRGKGALRGWWQDSSDGSGRVAKHNGGLMLDSQRDFDGPGDFGTTAATLRENSMRYGRWETKLRLKSRETNAQDYHVKVELIPARPADYHCGGQNITLADIEPHGSTVVVGAKALKGRREWTSSEQIGSLIDGASATFAVEMSKRHISWFTNGKLFATVRSRAAVPDVPMTMRMSLVGQGMEEMNRTLSISDWQRGFSLERGRLTTNGRSARLGTYPGGC